MGNDGALYRAAVRVFQFASPARKSTVEFCSRR
jgi:hypothetical protein